MSFGGGGGSSGVTAHVHNANAGQGGNLKMKQTDSNDDTKFVISTGSTTYGIEVLL